MTAQILVVDDDRGVRTALDVNLGKRGWQVVLADGVRAALRLLRERPFDVVLTDVKMPDGSGIDLVEQVKASWPETQVVVMTGFGSVSDAVRAMKAGAEDYLIKPIERDALYVVLDRAIAHRTLRAELVQLRRDVTAKYGFQNLVGASASMLSVYEDVAAVADSSATVLLQGATGTGKELLAHALHYRSRRAQRPFVRVNCTAIPENLLESELFGHEKGSFTGAIRQHRGKFEQADGGTLFLDEIGEMDLGMQSKLLRVLESGELSRIGGSETITVDVRVLAATNRDLQREVDEGRFRADLFYRLNVVTLRVPSLRERRDDVPLLVEHFVKKAAAAEQRDVPPVSADCMATLVAYDWPGNVRQLEHLVTRAVLLHRDGPWLDIALPEDTPSSVVTGPASMPAAPVLDMPLHDALDDVERRILLAALEACGGVQAQVAKRLGLSKSNLSYRLKRLGIERKDVRYG